MNMILPLSLLPQVRVANRASRKTERPSVRTSLLATVVLVLVMVRVQTRGDTLVAPNRDATAPGNGEQIPFNGNPRYLNIYHPSQFVSAMPEGGIITGISFRQDETISTPLSIDIPQIEIRLSTSPIDANGSASIEFAKDIGPDETVVFPAASLHFAAGGSPVLPDLPSPFSQAISFSTPFYYDPRNGSLAVDLRVIRGLVNVSNYPIDADNTIDSIAIAGGVNDQLGSNFLPALVMQVQYTAVPEPSTAILFALGLLFFLKKGGE